MRPYKRPHQALSELSPELRARVERIVHTHIKAVLKFGSPEEPLERIYLEAIEIARLEDQDPNFQDKPGDLNMRHEPRRHYDVYRSPLVE